MNTTPTWTPISRTHHANAGWLPYRDYQHAATTTATPLLAAGTPKGHPLYLK